MATNMVRNNPPVMAALQKNCLEHISLMAQEQVQLNLEKKCKCCHKCRNKQLQNPQVQQQFQQISQKIEATKSNFDC